MAEFVVPHLANKYHYTMGVPVPEFEAQATAMCARAENGMATPSLFNPETRAPGFRWSKHLYRAASKELLALVPSSARRVLSIGATMGHDEVELQRRGFDVSVMPLDAIFGDTLARRGLKVIAGRLEEAPAQPGGANFDVVFAADMLHLVPQPLEWIRAMTQLLSPGGEIVGSVSHTSSWLWPLKDWRKGRRRWVRPGFDRNGAQPMSEGRLARLCSASALELAEVVPSTEESPGLARVPGHWARRKLAPKLLFRIRRIR
jgi:SAM-dependent methyltransferase